MGKDIRYPAPKTKSLLYDGHIEFEEYLRYNESSLGSHHAVRRLMVVASAVHKLKLLKSFYGVKLNPY